MHILHGYVRCPSCRVVGPPASLTLAVGVDSRGVQCVACGEWHVVADVQAAMLVADTSVACPYCGTQVRCPTVADVVRCDPSRGSGCGQLFAGPASHRAAFR